MAILKLLHILFVFVWVGTLLMLTRLVAYLPKEEALVRQRVGDISRRMYLLIDLPSMLLAISLGASVICLKEINWKEPWLHLKLTGVFLLMLCDVAAGWNIVRRNFAKGTFYKILHGVAGLILIVILVALYIIKPYYVEMR